jgi:hypothetical protein
MLASDKTIATNTASDKIDPLVEFGGFSMEKAAAIRRVAYLIMFQVRTPRLPIYIQQADGHTQMDLRQVPKAIRKLGRAIETQTKQDAQFLGFEYGLWFFNICLTTVYMYDPKSLGIENDELPTPVKSPRKTGRPQGLTPVTEFIAHRALALRETTELTWPDIVSQIFDELNGKQMRTALEEDAMQRLSKVVNANDRNYMSIFANQAIFALRRHLQNQQAKLT